MKGYGYQCDQCGSKFVGGELRSGIYEPPMPEGWWQVRGPATSEKTNEANYCSLKCVIVATTAQSIA